MRMPYKFAVYNKTFSKLLNYQRLKFFYEERSKGSKKKDSKRL